MRTLSLLLGFSLLAACRPEGATEYVVDGDEDGLSRDEDCDDGDPAAGEPTSWYADADGDGYGDTTAATSACEAPSGYTDQDGDCDDADASVSPAATETCDGIDQDCDGTADDGAAGTAWYADSDGDTYGDAAVATEACTAPEGYVASATDCDDAREDVHPGADESDCTDPTDKNCDGSVGYADADGDGHPACEDCDDDATGVNPAATEICNDLDDDCDTLVDDADDSIDLTTGGSWYTDGDADGYGAGDTIVACDAPGRASALGGDCDDADPLYNPGATESDCTDPNDYNCDGSVGYADADGDGWAACTECDDTDSTVSPDGTEVCNDIDDDCDGTVDDGVGSLWYADADADTFGDVSDVSLACDAPGGSVADATDCDDTAAAVNPDGTELCNDTDDDCDGEVDDGVGTLWYADADADTFGDVSDVSLACDAPEGSVADASDCDDAEAAVNPDAAETCNEIDDDCDGDVDEDGGSAWYADADGDGYGDPATAISACDSVDGFVDNADDCDDADADAFPGAPERYDGSDNDCDGTIDDNAWAGSGADGSLSVTGTTTLSAAWVVSAIGTDTITVDGTPSLAAGDEVLIINMHGSDGAHTNVGVYEFAWVDAVSGSEITLTADLTETFGEVDNGDLTDQAIQVVRVGQYTEVTVAAGGLLTANAWDGATGGIVAFRATGTVTVEDGGAISVDELGYAAGETGTCSDCDAFQGESYAGEGDGNQSPASGVYANWTYGYYLANYGGGGAMITGGGGNYAGGATAGASWTGGSYPEAAAGETYGSADLSTMFLGSGGAGVWHGSSYPGPGGDGAGIVYVGANAISIAGEAGVSAIGGSTTAWATGSWTYGAGGGAGGSIWLEADTLTLASDAVDATGGFGEDTHIRVGGDGGYGRIRLDYATLDGDVASGTEPDATEGV